MRLTSILRALIKFARLRGTAKSSSNEAILRTSSGILERELLIFSRTNSVALFSSCMKHPFGREAKPSLISFSTFLSVFESRAANLSSKLYLLFACPIKSSTVRHSLSSARRSPRPSCCKKTVRLSVGRRNRTVFISGMSTPSL